ncbi:DUF6683 family protein [Nodosilinea sp. P-1105]|uniref:DUF6683 family protein n=1 Tax=Nodosilinea sp. P-1105 TaxID=2546229 RepID=UPI00146DFA5A|nr:DUF6683 family protein [Nodosilinea sp. P-1105]NMF82024.1 hypothetical protein [Nodosilinea sp. P-1105]
MTWVRPIMAGTAIATTLLLPLQPAKAQFTNPYTFNTWNNPISSSADTAIMNRAFQRMVAGSSSGTSAAVSPVAASSAPLGASSFRPVARQLMPQQLAGDPTLSPTDQQQLANLYAELLANYHHWLVEEGEQRLQHNVAGAMMYLLLTSHYVLNDGEELSQVEQDVILQNFNNALASDAHFQFLSARGKQELYETIVISAALPLALYFQGQADDDPSLITQAQAMAEATLIAILTDEAG